MSRIFLAVAVATCICCSFDGNSPRPGTDGGSSDAGATSDGSTGDAPSASRAAALCNPIAGAVVARQLQIYACNPDLVRFVGPFPDAQAVSAACFGGIGSYVDTGTVAVGRDSDLKACVDALDQMDCGTVTVGQLEACASIFDGTRALGGACEDSRQCAGSAFCASADGTCGICAAQRAIGVGCFSDLQCTTDYCSEVLGTCQARGTQGSTCFVDNDCLGRMECVGDLCVPERQWNVGDGCFLADEDCGEPFTDLFCNGAMCEAYLAIDDSCNAGVGDDCHVYKYERCNGAQCVTPQLGGLGATCSMAAGLACASNYCSNAIAGGVCVMPAVGSPCDSNLNDFACGVLLVCDENDTCRYNFAGNMCQ